MPADDELAAADASESVPSSDDFSPPAASRRVGLAWRLAIAIVVTLAIVVLVASQWNVPDYAITPGHAFNIGTLISVPRGESHSHRGAFILTDVELSQLSALGYLYYELHDSSEIVPAGELTGGQSSAAYDEEGVIDMADARQAATLVALRALGYPTKALAAGSAVYGIEPGTPSREVPSVGSVIVAADGAPTLTVNALVHAISALRPDSVVSLTFHAFGEAKNATRAFRVGRWVRSSKATGSVLECELAGEHFRGVHHVSARLNVEGCVPFGVVPTYRNVDVPFKVRLSSGGIVGPSAGLSFTLGLIEKLDRADLTGGKRIAATGTMSNNGSVGAVGGVAEKTLAVRAAGAQVFLVPPSGLQAARANAGSHLKVIAVSTIGQALSALERLGGRLEPAVHRVGS